MNSERGRYSRTKRPKMPMMARREVFRLQIVPPVEYYADTTNRDRFVEAWDCGASMGPENDEPMVLLVCTSRQPYGMNHQAGHG